MNLTAFTQLFEARAPFIIIPTIFVIVGLGYTAFAFWQFLTMNSTLSHSSKPKYDRLYLGLQLMLAIGWTGFVTVFFLTFLSGSAIISQHLIMLFWAILALGLGLLLVLRLDMIIAVTNYKAKHAGFPWRYFYQMQTNRYGTPWRNNLQRFSGGLFAVIGALILGYLVARFPTSMEEIRMEINEIATAIQTSYVNATR